jgi:Zn-dependent peptidase ImmA (M78 family)/DNA-binding XRE family transcriptional regulator
MDGDEGLIRDPHIAVLRFRPEQLTRGRELRGFTKTALATAVGKTAAALSQFESGANKPDARTLASLALALGIPVGFFARSPLGAPVRLEECTFRSLRSVSQYLRRQAVRSGELMHEVALLLEEEGVELPADQVTPLRDALRASDDIEVAAAELRRAWGLGPGPLTNPITLLESKGVWVLPLSAVCDDVDAFSMWQSQRPFVMLALHKPPSRVHFDAGHELGHLLLHEDAAPASPRAEREANHFAAAFLVPRETFLQECPRRWSFETFRALKRRWHVSIQALVYRAQELERLSTGSARRAFSELNRRGLRKRECDEWELARPTVLEQSLALVRDDLSLAALADRLGLHEAHLRELLEPVVG